MAAGGFAGIVRDHAEGRDGVEAMTYEAYEEPAIKAMGDIVQELRQRWPDVERVAVVHRVGRLDLSETSVLVVVSAPHRAAAFAACGRLVDEAKARLPIWKRQVFRDGTEEWVNCP